MVVVGSEAAPQIPAEAPTSAVPRLLDFLIRVDSRDPDSADVSAERAEATRPPGRTESTDDSGVPNSAVTRGQHAFARLGIAASTIALALPVALGVFAAWVSLVGALGVSALTAAKVDGADGKAAIWLAVIGGGALVAVARKRASRRRPEPPSAARVLLICGLVLGAGDVTVVPVAMLESEPIPDEIAGALIIATMGYAAITSGLVLVRLIVGTCQRLDRFAGAAPFRAGIVGAGLLALPVGALPTLVVGAVGTAGVVAAVVDEPAILEKLIATLDTGSAGGGGGGPPVEASTASAISGGSGLPLGPGGGGDDPTHRCFEELATPPPRPTKSERARRWLETSRFLHRAEAEDIAADVLLTVCTMRPNVDDLAPYYFKAVKHRANRHQRRTRRWEHCPIIDRIVCSLRNPEEAALADEEIELAHHLRCGLDDEAKFIVDRHIHDGATFVAIGAQLGKTPNAIKKKYRRALDSMRRQFSRYESDCQSRLMR